MKVGIDTTRISRFVDKREYFIKRILTSEEYELYLKEKTPAFLAIHWACKEAIFKATQDNKYLKYGVLYLDSGQPYVLNHPNFKLSVTHEGDYVTAIVIVE